MAFRFGCQCHLFLSKMFSSKDSSKRVPKCLFVKTSQLLEQPVCKYKKDRANEESQNLPEILSALKVALSEKSKVDNENAVLKQESFELQKQNAELHKLIEENKIKFNKDFNQFKAELQQSEQNIIDSGKRYFAQQKKYLSEIKVLNLEKERMKSTHEEREKELLTKIQQLEIDKLQQRSDYENLKTTCDEYTSKSNKYKAKLKSAISMINDLNSFLIQYTSKPDMVSTQVQTSEGSVCEESYVDQSSLVPYHSETDDILLSEIFFKSKAFCENELLLFNNDNLSQ